MDETGQVVQLPTMLHNVFDALEKVCSLLHLSLAFYEDMGGPITCSQKECVFMLSAKNADGERRAFAHMDCIRKCFN